MIAKPNRRFFSVRHVLVAIAASILVPVAFPATAQEAAHQAVLSHEQQLIARIQMLPDDQLKDAYSSCSQDAIQRTPSYGEIALCSIVYETLFKQVFGGDFDALLAWSRIRAQGAMEDAFAEETVFGMDSSRR